MPVRVLAVSDQIDPRIYSATLRDRMGDVQLVFGCGDVPARYLEFLADALDKPVYYVMGNHCEEFTRQGSRGVAQRPMGCIDLGGKVVRDPSTGLILAGIAGSPRYSDETGHQYSESQVRWMICKMAPRLLWNRLRHGRSLDVLITHAPPRDINDREDIPHRGFVAMRKFLERFKPRFQLHGHVHIYDRSEQTRTEFMETSVINVYPYKVLDLEFAVERLDSPRAASPLNQ
jgi:Icc-related predicted phosphoesterase